jgi:hypothetical protein
MREFGPPYPTHDWDAALTIGALCADDDPRGMLAWAVLDYDPGARGKRDLDDEVAGIFVEIYARLPMLEDGHAVQHEDTQRLLREIERLQEIVSAATALRLTRHSA